ncbi:hypothetical protein A2154_04120 [Candidatus Gottesmanbacteria bacterium RBG_16_43_7]|uniref:Uncharacterized protein n=1 Tax=Candidatus Gottesmanbacteria bacterium RBG_16_43_7 TaxID=1798373 RepID=A0A1F5Z8Z8_9BACT|nr:MAG: hypothetical protein A2154_04120 [Candidatus Gottesmanbacteria bacterium RBG_16_43_7]
MVKDVLKQSKLPSKNDISDLSKKIDHVTDLIETNQESLNQLESIQRQLNTLDKILISVDKIAGEVTTYRGQQELNSQKLINHGDRIEKLEKFTKIPPVTA